LAKPKKERRKYVAMAPKGVDEANIARYFLHSERGREVFKRPTEKATEVGAREHALIQHSALGRDSYSYVPLWNNNAKKTMSERLLILSDSEEVVSIADTPKAHPSAIPWSISPKVNGIALSFADATLFGPLELS
jgi:hypothetical protein